MQVTLKAKYHAFIIALMPDKGDVRKINYTNQVRRAITGEYDPEQSITVNVADSLVPELYSVIGSQQERLSSNDNAAIKEALIPQLAAYPDVAQAIGAIAQANARETEEIRTSGIAYFMSIEA